MNGPITPGLSSLLGITQTPLSLLVPTTSSFLQNNQSHLIQPAANTSVGPIPESTALGSHVNIPQANQLQQDQSSQTLVGGLPALTTTTTTATSDSAANPHYSRESINCI